MELKTYLSLVEGVGAGVKDVHSVRAKRVWIRPFGRLVYLMPPFVTSAQDISCLTGAIGSFVQTVG